MYSSKTKTKKKNINAQHETLFFNTSIVVDLSLLNLDTEIQINKHNPAQSTIIKLIYQA